MSRACDLAREGTTAAGARPSGDTGRWAFGAATIACASDDAGAATWLAEFLEPWFEPTRRTPGWSIEIHASRTAYASMRDAWPSGLERRGCFSLDERVSSLPARDVDGGVHFANLERSCFFTIRSGQVAMVADPDTPRWRFAAMRIIREIGTTCVRREALDVHAAAVEQDGRAILICGPKFSGKTTLALHLLRSGGCRLIANDRVLVRSGPGHRGSSADALGVPTAVKIRPATVRLFPELLRDLPRVAWPYLLTGDEIARHGGPSAASDADALSLAPFQVARRLGVDTCAGAPLEAVLFPEIVGDRIGVTVEPLAPEAVATRILAGRYGARPGRRSPTVFEVMDGGVEAPAGQVAAAIAATTSGFRVILGRGAYDEPNGAARVLASVRRR